jgi:hypothetical protein
VIPTELPFEEIWLHDFEFIARPGERPDVVCLSARELRSGRTLRLWRNQLSAPSYRTDRDALFVSFVANAECTCHLALGWPPPARVLDLSPAFRNITNGRTTPEGKSLVGARAITAWMPLAQNKKTQCASASSRAGRSRRKNNRRSWLIATATLMRCYDYCRRSYQTPILNSLWRCITASLPLRQR